MGTQSSLKQLIQDLIEEKTNPVTYKISTPGRGKMQTSEEMEYSFSRCTSYFRYSREAHNQCILEAILRNYERLEINKLLSEFPKFVVLLQARQTPGKTDRVVH